MRIESGFIPKEAIGEAKTAPKFTPGGWVVVHNGDTIENDWFYVGEKEGMARVAKKNPESQRGLHKEIPVIELQELQTEGEEGVKVGDKLIHLGEEAFVQVEASTEDGWCVCGVNPKESTVSVKRYQLQPDADGLLTRFSEDHYLIKTVSVDEFLTLQQEAKGWAKRPSILSNILHARADHIPVDGRNIGEINKELAAKRKRTLEESRAI